MRVMGFLDRLRPYVRESSEANAGAPPIVAWKPGAPSRGSECDVFDGHETLEVVGESYRQDVLRRIVGAWRQEPVSCEIVAVLSPHPYEGEHADPNAIQVLIHGELVGYLSRHDAAVYHPGLLALMARCPTGRVGLNGVICGGGPRVDGPGMLGVFLHHDPALFGVSARHSNSIPGFRTGLTEAIASDVEDDSYDLAWLSFLPASDAAAIKKLRELLASEHDPIDRHFMYSELETRLYKGREAFASALVEYDAACQQHDLEMAAIRPALLEKFGRVPVIDMYRQAAIRCQKARDWQGVRRWAQRGVEIYGSDAARPEVVDDLEKRKAYASTKLELARPR